MNLMTKGDKKMATPTVLCAASEGKYILSKSTSPSSRDGGMTVFAENGLV
jgi:hypothetical protein